jgi:nitrite reductase/ring-hydroxylating ferredoxin subunit/uncharacterized membrane protein
MKPLFRTLAERLHDAKALDPIADALSGPVYKAAPGGSFQKDLLSGTWLGHPLHPMLTDVTIGAWTGAALLDLLGGDDTEDAARGLIALGALSAIPTAVTGLADWSDTGNPERRVGVVHALANVVALGLYTAGWAARRNGRTGRGKLLSFAGFATASFSGFLGGHIAYGRGVGVAWSAFEPMPAEWKPILPADDLTPGKPTLGDLDGTPVLLYRSAGRIFAIGARCTHRGGPLQEGEIDDEACAVTCPWHASRFSLEDGRVLHGPATAPQQGFEARVHEGNVEIRVRSEP